MADTRADPPEPIPQISRGGIYEALVFACRSRSADCFLSHRTGTKRQHLRGSAEGRSQLSGRCDRAVQTQTDKEKSRRRIGYGRIVETRVAIREGRILFFTGRKLEHVGR